jgi:hypothetical protein
MDKVFEGIGSFISAVGPAGYPTSLLGGVLMLFFYLRKQEAGVRNDIVLSLQRLQKDKEALQERVDTLQSKLDAKQSEVDALIVTRRAIEDAAYNETKRVESLLETVRRLQRDRESD